MSRNLGYPVQIILLLICLSGFGAAHGDLHPNDTDAHVEPTADTSENAFADLPYVGEPGSLMIVLAYLAVVAIVTVLALDRYRKRHDR